MAVAKHHDVALEARPPLAPPAMKPAIASPDVPNLAFDAAFASGAPLLRFPPLALIGLGDERRPRENRGA